MDLVMQLLKPILGFVLAFAIGSLCRISGVPVPAPPALVGALLVLSMTLGYLAADRWARRRLDAGSPPP
jgi:XapX domain-containing protein